MSVNVVLELFENAGCFWAEEGVSDCVLAPFDMFGGMYGDRYTLTPRKKAPETGFFDLRGTIFCGLTAPDFSGCPGQTGALCCR